MSVNSLDVAEQVDALMADMTVAEKAGQLTQYFYFNLPPSAEIEATLHTDFSEQPRMVEAALRDGKVGSLLFVTDPAEINRLQRLALSRAIAWAFPSLFGFDVIHGLRTILPVPIAMAASWDPATIEQGQAVAAREARAVGIHWAFAPMVDIARDPRWGRIIEGAGRGPISSGAQSPSPRSAASRARHSAQPDRIIAGPKHFAGYGAALGGRDYDEVNLSDSELWNVYLPPFKAAVEAGAGNIMTAYMALNGIPATGNRGCSDDVLRQTWGFDGFVVSDAQAVRNLLTHGFAADLTDAARAGLQVGLDLEMAITDPAYAHLPEAVEAGARRPRMRSTRRSVGSSTAKLRLGLLDDPYVDEDRAREVLADPAHRAGGSFGRRSDPPCCCATRATCCPSTSPGSIAVIGPLADSPRDTHRTVGLRLRPGRDGDGARRASAQRAGDDVEIELRPRHPSRPAHLPVHVRHVGRQRAGDPADFDDDAELARAVATARDADVAVVVLGEWQNMIGEAASRSSIWSCRASSLPLLAGRGRPPARPSCCWSMNGRPLDLRWAADNVPAILDIWYPGTQGGAAVADLLFGDVAPGGKLPFTWPRTVGQVPMIYSHTISHEPDNQGRRYWDEQSTPLFPFGHGLSYGRFDYTDLVLDRTSITAGETVTVSVTVTNSGPRAGDEVAQLYIPPALRVRIAARA